jgi:hypothetical protein
VDTIRVDNAEIAAQLEAYAALLELNGASYYTALAYRRTAELIRDAAVGETIVTKPPRSGTDAARIQGYRRRREAGGTAIPHP